MLAEFAGEMVECDEVHQLSWGPKVLIKRAPSNPEEKAKNRAYLLSICANVQNDLIRESMQA